MARLVLASVLFLLSCCVPECEPFSSTLPWIPTVASRRAHFDYSHEVRYLSNPRYRRRRSACIRMREQIADVADDEWLQGTTETILESQAGSLVKGKWHELVSMMTAWSKRATNDRNAPLVLERLLKRAIDEWHAGNTECCPSTDLYNYVIDGWTASAKSSEFGRASSRRSRQILHLLQQTYDAEKDPRRRPDAHSFLSVLKAVCQTEKPPVARKMLHWMEELYRSGQNHDAKPTMAAFVNVLDALANSAKEDAGEQAEQVLQQMNATGVAPSTLCYNIAIKAWIKARRGRQSAEHAERILDEMQTEPDCVTFSSAIHAWATSGMREHAAERAEAILCQLEGHSSVSPNVVVYNACLNAWCKSKSPMTVNRTETLLKRMESSDHVSPDLVSYNTYIHALGMMRNQPEMAQRADDILSQLEERFDAGESDLCPNVFSYNLVMEGWVRSGAPNAASRACDVLRKLVKRDGVEPDAVSFNQAINALSRSSLPGAAKKAEDLLHFMDESFKSGVYNFKADVVGYTSAISAWSRSGEPGSAGNAERLLNQMEQRYLAGEVELKPSNIVFNAVIDAWARSGEGTLGARRAEALLQRMQDMYENGDTDMQPDIISFNSCLNAWARSNTRCCAYKAELYLNRMWELYNAGNTGVKPDRMTYNTVINAISKSKNEGKAQKALRVLRRMDKLYQAGNKDTRPSERTYTAVLNSCAFPSVLDQKSRMKALDTAIFTLAELQGSPYGKPNHLTYGTFFKAAAALMPRDDELRRMIVEPVFLQCVKDGQCGEMVLAHLRYAAPKDLYRELLKGVAKSRAKITLKDVPQEWRRNVADQQRWRSRTCTAVKRKKTAVRKKS